MFYGAVVWDPWLIAAQIVLLQCLFYLTLGVFTGILVGTRVSRMSLVYFFDYATVTASTVTGWCVIGSFLLSSLAAAVYMPFLIERAKKCLDFAATLYIIHLFICFLYGGWPSSMTWWVVNGTGMAVMALLGEYLCIRRELREIPITRYRSSANLSPVFESQDTREAGLIHEMFEPASAVQWEREKKSKELRVLGIVAAQLKEIVPKLLLFPFRKMSFLLWVIGF